MRTQESKINKNIIYEAIAPDDHLWSFTELQFQKWLRIRLCTSMKAKKCKVNESQYLKRNIIVLHQTIQKFSCAPHPSPTKFSIMTTLEYTIRNLTFMFDIPIVHNPHALQLELRYERSKRHAYPFFIDWLVVDLQHNAVYAPSSHWTFNT